MNFFQKSENSFHVSGNNPVKTQSEIYCRQVIPAWVTLYKFWPGARFPCYRQAICSSSWKPFLVRSFRRGFIRTHWLGNLSLCSPGRCGSAWSAWGAATVKPRCSSRWSLCVCSHQSPVSCSEEQWCWIGGKEGNSTVGMGARRTKGLLTSYSSGQALQKQGPSLPPGTPISILSCLVTSSAFKNGKKSWLLSTSNPGGAVWRTPAICSHIFMICVT